MKSIFLLGAAFMVAGCATFTGGSSQEITLSSNAEGAMCGISQNGQTIVPLQPVPATHEIGKASGNLIVSCEADGYEPATVALIAGKDPMAVTGMMLTGVLGFGADAMTTAWHEYQGSAFVYLNEKPSL